MKKLFYRVPGQPLSTGCKPIHDDSSILGFIDEVVKNKSIAIQVYVVM